MIRNNTKKRPNNLVFGRIFEQQKLDLIELGLTKYEEIDNNNVFFLTQTKFRNGTRLEQILNRYRCLMEIYSNMTLFSKD